MRVLIGEQVKQFAGMLLDGQRGPPELQGVELGLGVLRVWNFGMTSNDGGGRISCIYRPSAGTEQDQSPGDAGVVDQRIHSKSAFPLR
jgi:hypothetical protein